jgi:hypothetical protein
MSSMIESPTVVTGPATGAVPGAPLEVTTDVEVVVDVDVDVDVGAEVDVGAAAVDAEGLADVVARVAPDPEWMVVGVPEDADGVTAAVSWRPPPRRLRATPRSTTSTETRTTPMIRSVREILDIGRSFTPPQDRRATPAGWWFGVWVPSS